jgi:menaquinone-9 beta-reductase
VSGPTTVVVGAGPAGSSTAALLARQGQHVVLLDRARFPREKPCAEYLSPGVADALDRIGALDRVLALHPARPQGMRIQTASSSFVLRYDGSDVPRTGLGLPREALDAALVEHAAKQGAEVRERTHALGAMVEDGRVVGVRVRDGERIEEIKADFVVGADGIHSVVSRSLGLDRAARWPARLGLIARYAGVPLGPFGEMFVGHGFYCGVAPVGSGMVNVGLVGPMERPQNGEPIERFFERRLAQVPGARELLSAGRRVTSVRGVGPLARRVSRVSGPGYLLVGDAAGFLDPFTGEGVHRALLGGELAAQSIVHAMERDDRRPVGYEAARRKAFADKERVCLLVQLFLACPPLFSRLLQHLAHRPAVARQLAGVLGDYRPAAPALRPRYLWSLLRP